jgi:excisionase family DNA binding protein
MDLDLLTPDQVCGLLKVRKSWLYDEVEAGRLPHLRLGRQLRFRPSDIADYLDRAAIAGRGGTTTIPTGKPSPAAG